MAQYGAASTSSKNIWDIDPRNVGGCTLWLDGNDATTMFTDAGTTLAGMGASVYQWNDKSVSANHGIMTTAGTRPIRAVDTGFSNLPTLSFNGSQWFSLDITKLPTGQANSTIFAVFRHIPPPYVTQNNTIISYGGPLSDNGGTHRVINAATASQISMEDGLTTVYQNVSSVITSCGVLMFQDFTMSGWVNGSSAANSPYDLGRQPGFVTTGTGTTAAWVGYPQRQGGGRNPFIGNIHEILVFNRGLGNSERQIIEGYLAWKWGFISRLPTSHPYYSTTLTRGELTSSIWNPGNLGPNLWLDTSVANNVLTYPVIQWYDKSGQNNHAVALSNSGYVKYTSGQFLTSNGLTGRLQILDPSDPFVNTTFTVFLVERRGSTRQNVSLVGGSATVTNSNFLLLHYNATSFRFGFFNNDIAASIPVYTTNEPFRIWTIVFKGTSGGKEIWLNGTLVSSNSTQTANLISNTGWTLLGGLTSATLQSDGDFREFISYKTFLNTTDQQNVEGYLAWKWGLQENLPVGHPYKSVAPSGFVPTTSITTSGASCRLWFDAADTTTVTQPLTRWLDKSGLNNHADARLGSGSSGNAMRTDALVNSRRLGVGGNGATTRLQINDVLTPFSSSFTIFVVERRGSGKDFNTVFAGSLNNNYQGVQFYYRTASVSFSFAGAANPNIILSYAMPTYVNNEPYRIWSLVFKGANLGREIWLNGTFVASDTPVQNITLNTGWALFNYLSSLVVGDGHTREIISYKTFLNTTDQQNVEGYLAWKWGLQANLPAAHPWSTTTSPGGYTGSYAPPNTSITTSGAACQLWFDGNDTTTMAETEFHIRDRSGNNRHAAGISSALTYTTASQNGLNGVDFISSPRLFTPQFSVGSANSRLTIFMVLKQTSPSISSTFDMVYGTPRTNLAMYLNTSGNYGTIVNTTPDSLTTFTSSQNTIGIYRVTININGTTVNSQFWSRQYVNGTFYTSFSASNLGTSLSVAQTLNLLNGGMNGTIYEVVSYSNELTEFQSRLVEGHLAWKWGIQESLDNNHPYDPPNYLMDRTRPFARSFVPNDIDGCQLWIDPADSSTITMIGSNVTSIADKSGLGNNAMNITSTIKYTDTLNGRNVITSPSSGSGAFNPSSISGCALWLDASDSTSVSVTTGNVTGWTDKAFGYTSTASNSTAIQYIPNASNGLPVIRIGSTPAYFTFGNINNIGTQEFNIFAVFKASTITSVNSIIGKGSATTTGWWFGYNQSGSALQTQYGGGNIGYTNTSGFTNYTIVSSMNPRTSGNTHYYNGTLLGTGSINSTSLTNTSNLRVGSQDNNFTVTNTDFAEIIMYIGSISTTQRQQIEGYLAQKWGLSGNLPNGHPYYTNYQTIAAYNRLYTQFIPRNPVNHSFFYVFKYPSSVTSGAIPLYYGNSYFGHTGTTAPLLEDNNVIAGGITASSAYGNYASATAFYGDNTFVCASVRQNDKITLTTNGRSYGTTGGSALGNETLGQYSIQLSTGQLAELIVYNSALSDGDRQMVEGYLMWKWGVRSGVAVNPNVTIPTTHSYYRNPPVGVTPDLPGLQLYRTAESVLGDLQPTLWLDPQDPTTYGVDANNRVQYIFNKRNLINSAPLTAVSSTSSVLNGSTYNTGLTGTPIFINQPLKMFGTIGATSGTGILYNTVYYAAHIYTVNSVAADGFTLNISVASGSSVAITTNRYVVFNADIPGGLTSIQAGKLYFARTITGTAPTTAFTVSATSGGANITGLTPGTLTGVRGTHAGLMRFSLAPNDTPITTLNNSPSAYFNLCDTTTGISGTGIGLNGPLLTQSTVGTGAGLNYFDFSTGGSFPITSASIGGGGTALTLVVGANNVLITTGTITSNIATVNFIYPGYVLFAQGQQITISGSTSTSTSFNGTFTIISCNQTSVTFALTGSGTVTGGIISVYLPHNIPTNRQITLTIPNGLYSDTTSATALTGTYTTQSGTAGNNVVLTIPSAPVGPLTSIVGRVDYGNILLTNIQMTNGSSTATFTTSGVHNLVATTDSIFLSLPDTTVANFPSPTTIKKLHLANGQYTVASTPTTTTFTVTLKQLGGSEISPTISINQTLVSNTKPAFAYFPINGYCLDNRFANYILPGSSGFNTIIAVTHLNPGPGTVISSQAARSGSNNANQTPIISTSITLDGSGGNDLNNINGVGAASSIGIGRDFNTRLSNFGSNGIRGSIRRCQSNGADVSPTDTSAITNTTNGFRIMTHTFCNTSSSATSDISPFSHSTAFGGWRNMNSNLAPIQYNSDYYGYSSGTLFTGSSSSLSTGSAGGIRIIAGSTVGTTATLTLIPFGWEPDTNPFHQGQAVSVIAATPVAGYNLTGVTVTAVTPTTVSYTVAAGTASFTGGSGIIIRTIANNVNTNISHLRIGADTSATKSYTSSFLTDNFFDGGVGDILVFNTVLSLEQRQFVEGYLAQKYRFQQFLGASTTRYDQDNGTYTGLSLDVTGAICANVGPIPIPTVTLTFTNPRTTNPFVLASTITVANITTSGYNGTFFVTDYSTQSPWTVSYAVSSLLTTPAVLGTLPTAKTNVSSTNLMVHPYKSSPSVIDGRLTLSTLNAQNLITWFDASNRSSLGLCGARVCEWQSSGGAQTSLYQPFPQMQPLYVTNALNGLPGIRFMLPVVTGGTIISITSTALLRIVFPAGLVPTLFKVFIPAASAFGLIINSVYVIRSITFVSGTTYDVTFSQNQIFAGVFTSATASSGSVACSFYDFGLLYSGNISGITTADSISTRILNHEFTYIIVFSRAVDSLSGNILHFGGGNSRIIIRPLDVSLVNAGVNIQQTFTFPTIPNLNTPYILVVLRRGNIYSFRLIGNNGYITQTSSVFGDLRVDIGNPGINIGAYSGVSDTNSQFAGDIYETCLFRTALSEQALQVVEGYLAWKWGFVSSLPSTHAYKRIRP